MDLGPLFDSDEEDIVRFTLFPDGTLESCGGQMRPQDCGHGTWEKHGSSDNEYDLFEPSGFTDMHATVLPGGITEFRFEGDFIEGTWESGAN